MDRPPDSIGEQPPAGVVQGHRSFQDQGLQDQAALSDWQSRSENGQEAMDQEDAGARGACADTDDKAWKPQWVEVPGMQTPGCRLQETLESAMRWVRSQPVGDEGLATGRCRGLGRQGAHQGAQRHDALVPDLWSVCRHKGSWAYGRVQRCPFGSCARSLWRHVGSEAETLEEYPPPPRNELALPNL